MSRTTLVLGATGLTGHYCLGELLNRREYSEVRVLARRLPEIQDARLRPWVIGLEQMEDVQAAFEVDDVFCCLGTTIRAAGSPEAFRRVDHDFCVEAARLAHASGVHRFLMISAVNANIRSRQLYSRTKGEAERDIEAQGLEQLVIFQPSLLLGHRNESRPAEQAGQWLSGLARPLLHRSRSDLTPVSGERLAAAMVAAALGPDRPGTRRLRYRAICELTPGWAGK